MTTTTNTNTTRQDQDQALELWQRWQRNGGAVHLTVADAQRVIDRRNRYNGPTTVQNGAQRTR